MDEIPSVDGKIQMEKSDVQHSNSSVFRSNHLAEICWSTTFSSPLQAMQNRLTSQNKNKISLLVCFCVAGSAKWADVTDSHAEPGGLWERWTYISDGCKHAGRDQTGTKEIFIQWVWVVGSPSYFVLKALHWSLFTKYIWLWQQNTAKVFFLQSP